MKNRILNIVILLLVIGCLFFGSKIGFEYYMNTCEEYNNNIIGFTVELIKGNKSLEDISRLNASDKVKEGLSEYYNVTFYDENELILIYEGMDYFYKNKENLKQIQQSFGDDLKNNPDCSYFYQYGIAEGDCTEEESQFAILAMNYFYFYEDIKDVEIIEDKNNLYIKAKDLTFDNNEEIFIYYKGLRIGVNKYTLDKTFKNIREKDNNYQTLKMSTNFKEDKTFISIFKNDPKEYRVIVTLNSTHKWGKIDDLKINVSY